MPPTGPLFQTPHYSLRGASDAKIGGGNTKRWLGISSVLAWPPLEQPVARAAPVGRTIHIIVNFRTTAIYLAASALIFFASLLFRRAAVLG